MTASTRRQFLEQVALGGAAVLAAGRTQPAADSLAAARVSYDNLAAILA
jgi:hypothetical protein